VPELLRSAAPTTTTGSARVDPIAAALETGSAIDDVEAVLTAASASSQVSVSIQPIRDNGERAIAALAICHRVVQREVDRRKDEFLAVLGHELRNPLGAVLTTVRMLQLKGAPEPGLQKLRETILRQTLHLSKLVDDLLDVSRIDTGKLRVDKQRVELNAIGKDAVDACTSLIDERHHTLTVVLSPTPIIVEVDSARIGQVICNLLNNAAKYQKEGGRVELTASAESGVAVIRVRDDGVGIAPEMIDRIFERFVQIGSSLHRDQGGLGIGLSIVKAVVELHGGRLQARSEGVGRGSVFIVTLPIVPPQP
jgi:signal transduction histidine kinase